MYTALVFRLGSVDRPVIINSMLCYDTNGG